MRVFKWLGGFATALVLVIVAAAFLIPRVVRTEVEAASLEATGVPARLGDIDMAWTDGGLTIRDLRLDAPPGFEGEHVLWVDRLTVDVDVSTVFDNILVLDEIRIEGVELVLEQRAARLSTKDLARHIQTYLSAVDTTDARLMRVNTLRLSSGKARLSTDVGDSGDFDIPDLLIHDLGTEDGAPLAVILANIVEPLLERATINLDSMPGALGRLRDRFGI